MSAPEFLQHNDDSVVQLNLHSDLAGNKLVSIICLNGQQLDVKYHAQKATVGDIFSLATEHQNLKDKYLFGLAQLKGEEFIFLELDSKISKHLNVNRFLTLIDDNANESITLYFRVKFYVDGDLLRYPSTKNMFYLQFKIDIFENRISCDIISLVILSSFALQCDYGDYLVENNNISYNSYIPKWLTIRDDYSDIIEQIKSVYISHCGMSRQAAKQHYLDKIFLLPEYGFHFYSVLQEKQNSKSQVYLGISPQGITIFDNRKRQNESRLELRNFPWKSILRFTFDKCQFLVFLQNQSLRHRIVNYQFYTHCHDFSKYLFNLASSHHRFYLRFELKSRDSFNSLISSEFSQDSLKSNLQNGNSSNKKYRRQKRKTKQRSQSMSVLNASKPRSGLPKAIRTLTRYDKASTFLIPKRLKRHLLSSVFKIQGTYTLDDGNDDDAIEVANDENISALLSEAGGTISDCILNESKSPSLQLNRSISDSLAQRFDNMTGIEMKTERKITAVTLKRDSQNTLGITIMKGVDGAAYIKDAKLGSTLGIYPGDRILAVNGKSVQSMCFTRVVDLIRNSGDSVELVLSQTVRLAENGWITSECIESLPNSPKYLNSNVSSPLLCSELIFPTEQRRRPGFGDSATNAKGQSFVASEGRNAAINYSNSQSGSKVTQSNCGEVLRGRNLSDPSISTSGFIHQNTFHMPSLDFNYGSVTDVGELMFSPNVTAMKRSVPDSGLDRKSFDCGELQWVDKPVASAYDYVHLFLKKINGYFGFQWKSEIRNGNQCEIVIESVSDELQHRIKHGDIITEIGGQSVFGLSQQQVLQLLEDSHQVIHLAIKRKSQTEQCTPQRVRSICGTRTQTVSQIVSVERANTMVSKHEQPVKDSVESDFSNDSPTSSASTPDLDDTAEPKTVVWQRSISGSVKARISNFETQTQNGFQRSSFSPKPFVPRFSSLDRPPSSGESEMEGGKPVEKCLAVKSRPYRPHHSAQLLRSKTMPSVWNGVNEEAAAETPATAAPEAPKWSIPTKRTIFTHPVRTAWSSPRASSIDDGGQNARYNSFEALGVARPGLPTSPFRKSFNGPSTLASHSTFQSIVGQNNESKTNHLLPEPIPRLTRSLTPECILKKASPVRQTNTDFSAFNDVNTHNDSHSVNWNTKLSELNQKFPFINQKTVFKVCLKKNSRGLGIGICGGRAPNTADNWSSVFIRVKRLYPLQPALECGQLKIGDIILQVNEHHLIDLVHHEAVEALRVASGNVLLLICRPPLGVLPPVPINGDYENNTLRGLSPVINISVQYDKSGCIASTKFEEFDVEIQKINGSLGFTLVNDENTMEAGHFIKDLVKDPALSDGRIQPGDQIVMVNDIEIKGLSHDEAIQCLRKSQVLVKLVLCRPVQISPSSPPTDPTEELSNKDKKVLRKEAQDLLSDKTRRKSFESNSNSTCSSSGRRQRLKGGYTSNNLSVESLDHGSGSNSDADSRRSTPTPTECFRVPNVRSFLSQEALDAVDASLPSLVSPPSLNKPTFLPLERKTLDSLKGNFEQHEASPGSVPALHVSDWEPDIAASQDEPQLRSPKGQITYVNGNNGDAFHLSPSNSFRRVVSCDGFAAGLIHSTPKENFSSAGLKKWRGTELENETIPENVPANLVRQTAWEMMVINLNRQNNDRLGFTLLPVEVGNLKGSFVRAIQTRGLAGEDGRLQAGDHLLKVNGINTAEMTNADVIEILRKQHGQVSLEIERHPVVTSFIQNLLQLSLV